MSPLAESVPTRRLLRHGSLRYELMEPLGRGGMGDVHAARVVGGLERRVCIKLLAGTVEPGHAAALRQEARVLASVRHANVVSLLAFAEDEELGPFLVLELVDGLDLRALSLALRPERLATEVAVHVACALLRALAAVQRCLPGLVHRDVTPHNVLLSIHGEVKLADFGIALARDRTRWIRPSVVHGKPGYMSPEHQRGDELDPRSDQFAVGLLLHELLFGRPPSPPASPRPRPPSGLLGAVERMLSPTPGDRFVCHEDALRALGPFGAGEFGSLRLASLVDFARRDGRQP